MNTSNKRSGYFTNKARTLITNIKSHAFFRLVLIGSVISITTLIFLGIHIYMICQGLFLAILQLSPVWKPAKNVVNLITSSPENESLFSIRPLPQWLKIWNIVLSLPWLALTGFGVWLLIDKGFLEMNFIYLLFFK